MRHVRDTIAGWSLGLNEGLPQPRWWLSLGPRVAHFAGIARPTRLARGARGLGPIE
ncbi:MAG: hypothetical protein VX681_14405 [Myxococcota bacterium]|nr:hypothetical protein [Myxococcota bacterium]